MNCQIPSIETADDYSAILRANRRIALESDIIANFKGTAQAVIPRLVNFAKTQFSKLSFTSPAKPSIGEFNKLIDFMEKLSPSSASEIQFYVPEGYKGNIFEYVKYLLESFEFETTLVADVLIPYNEFLAKVISSSDFRKSNVIDLKFITSRKKKLDELVKRTDEFFDADSSRNQQKFGNITDRVSDLQNTAVALITLRKSIEVLDNKLVQKYVNDCSELLNSINEISRSNEINSISGDVLKTLGEATLIVAREVEFYAITLFRADIFYNQLIKTSKELTK